MIVYTVMLIEADIAKVHSVHLTVEAASPR